MTPRDSDHDDPGTGQDGASAFLSRGAGPVLIIGGAGFIGTNLASRLAAMGVPVRIYDNLSRPGVERNIAWLRREHGSVVGVTVGDVRDPGPLEEAVDQASAMFHFAAQVAVTTSLVRPQDDFSVNAQGTLNVLEALRRRPTPCPLLFTSTNKVYGALDDVGLDASATRWAPNWSSSWAKGVDERRPLRFHSPYGCSKGAADQYVLDYAYSFGLPTVVFRMSCIYGPHQLGTEDQGWVAHFAKSALAGDGITLYGDGRQVRDLLFVEDLVDAMLLAVRRIGRTKGRAFNIGGGPDRATSLVELIDLIKELSGRDPPLEFAGWRVGDQRWYVSDTSAFTGATGWQPGVGVEEGVERLLRWLEADGVRVREPSRKAERSPMPEVLAS